MSEWSQLSSNSPAAGEAVSAGSGGDAMKTDSCFDHQPIRPQEDEESRSSIAVDCVVVDFQHRQVGQSCVRLSSSYPEKVPRCRSP